MECVLICAERPRNVIGSSSPNIIGQGLQFTVYQEGERVRKKPNAISDILRILAKSSPQNVVNPLGLGREARRIARERDAAVAEFKAHVVKPELVANAEVRGRTIVQDKVVPLGKALSLSDSPNEILDAFVRLTRDCWRNGFSETSFNFTVNHGLTSDGAVVVIDIGEISFARDVVQRHVSERIWSRCWSLTNDLNADLRSYAVDAFDAAFTVEALNAFWADAPLSG